MNGPVFRSQSSLSFPIQIVWEDVIDEKATIPRKIKESRGRDIEDRADRTWDPITTLYYKRSGRIPWRRLPREGEYTNGSIPYYGTYPGRYDPRPLLLCPHESCDSTISQIAEEVLALTKINWNSTQMNQRLPIPIRAARKVGEVLKYVDEGQPVSTDYTRYI